MEKGDKSESVCQKETAFVTTKYILTLIETDCLTPAIPESIRFKKASLGLKKMKNSNTSPDVLDIKLDPRLIKTAYADNLRDLADEGILDTPILVDIKQINLTNPSKVVLQATGDETTHYNPHTGEIVFNTHTIQNILEQIKRSTIKEGVNLNEEQLTYILIRIVLAHEYGHSYHQFLERRPHGKSINRDIFLRVGHNHELDSFFKNNEKASFDPDHFPDNSSRERISTGFEIFALRKSLLKLGMTKPTTEAITNNYLNEYKFLLSDIRTTLQTALKKGLHWGDLADQLFLLREYLINKPSTKKLADLIGTYGYDARIVGYAFPLDQSQLKSLNTLVY